MKTSTKSKPTKSKPTTPPTPVAEVVKQRQLPTRIPPSLPNVPGEYKVILQLVIKPNPRTKEGLLAYSLSSHFYNSIGHELLAQKEQTLAPQHLLFDAIFERVGPVPPNNAEMRAAIREERWFAVDPNIDRRIFEVYYSLDGKECRSPLVRASSRFEAIEEARLVLGLDKDNVKHFAKDNYDQQWVLLAY